MNIKKLATESTEFNQGDGPQMNTDKHRYFYGPQINANKR